MHCTAADAFETSRTLEVSQGPGERQPYDFDLTDDFAIRWTPGPHTTGATVRPRSRLQTGLEYVSSGGVSSGREPIWPTTVGDTVVDGTITWTAQAISTDSLRYRIDSVEWTASGITASDQEETDAAALQLARIYISGGAAGQSYQVSGLVTDDQGNIHECRLIVNVV